MSWGSSIIAIATAFRPYDLRLDSFTVLLHSPKLGLCKGTVSGLWKMVQIPTGHTRPQSIVTEAILTFIKTNQLQKGDASQ